LGAVVGGWIGSGLLKAKLPEQVGVGFRIVALGLLAVGRILPIHIGIALGLFPGFTLGVVLVLAGGVTAVLLPRSTRWTRGPTAGLVAGWLLFYACFAAVTWYKAGPSAAHCASVIEGSSAPVLLDRFGEGGEYLDVEPYDVLPLADPGAVLVSFKRINRHGGFLEVLQLDDPKQRTRLRTWKKSADRTPGARKRLGRSEADRNRELQSGDGIPLWPERLEADPRSGLVYAQLLGTEDYAIWEIQVETPAGGGGPAAQVRRKLPIRWEPGNPAIDSARRKLVLSFVPNREADNPLLESIDLRSFQEAGGTPKPGPRLEMADYAAADPATGHYYVPAFYDNARFALAEVDGDSLEILRQRETYFATVGLAADGARDRLYLTNVLAGGLYVLRQLDFSTRQVLPAGRFPRDLVLDRRRQRLYVGGYGDGIVRAYSLGGEEVRQDYELSVGPLLRGVGLDPQSGRVFAASACGVFEVAGPQGQAPVLQR
ncbi:MAG: hypothetical protein VX498_11655, partial [Myxococcota bacterium]|nr:hypothetical protein [Myxococcota bacterium]